MRSRPSGSELALRNRGIATGALRRSCSHSSRHFEPRYYREQKEESQSIWTRSEAVIEKDLWIIFKDGLRARPDALRFFFLVPIITWLKVSRGMRAASAKRASGDAPVSQGQLASRRPGAHCASF